VIERFVTTVRALAALPPAELHAPAARRLADDCADALRLELDCPQQDFTPGQRSVLRRLGTLLDADPPPPELPRVAATACTVLGIMPVGRGRAPSPPTE
jgi:hypothetical protein